MGPGSSVKFNAAASFVTFIAFAKPNPVASELEPPSGFIIDTPVV